MKINKRFTITKKIIIATMIIIGIQSSISVFAEGNYLGLCEMPPSEKSDSPWDYRTRKDRLELVESRHFTRSVELLIRGESTANLASDIAYTLRMFPNHHRALASLVRYSELKRQTSFPGMKYSVECYLQRAVNFKEDDLQVRIIYASFLSKNRNFELAIKHLEYIEQSENISSAVTYNMGLVYFEIGNYEKSLRYAHKAYTEGFPFQGLKNKLIRIGKWREPVSDITASPDAN